MELLGYELSVRKIAKVPGCSSHNALNTSISKRDLHPKMEEPIAYRPS
jgi:hypothetical protein